MLSFGTPVLAVALEAVRDVEGPEPLSTLLTLFSKCKEQLQDGPRLENMCWRLWHQEHVASYPASSDCSSSAGTASCSRSDCDSVSEHSDSYGDPDELEVNHWKYDAYRACSPVSDYHLSSRHSHGTSIVHSSRRSSSTTSQKPSHLCDSIRPGPFSRRNQSLSSPGKIMADLIPAKFDARAAKNKSVCDRNDWSASISTLNVQNDIMVGTALTEEPKNIHYPSPPAINYETAVSLNENSTKDHRTLPQVQIVNPTPHPTPPMTPLASTAPVLGLSLVKQDRLVVPVRIMPLTACAGNLPAPVKQPELLILSSTAAHGHGPLQSQYTHERSLSEKIPLPISPPRTATSIGSNDSHHHHVQAQLTIIDRSHSGRPLSALPPRSSDHKFFIAQNGESPDSQHHPDASGSSVVSGGIVSQSSNSHSALDSQDSHRWRRRNSHEVGHTQAHRLTDAHEERQYSGISHGANAVIQPSSVTSMQSHGTTRSHASTGSSNANRVKGRNTKKGKDIAARPNLRRSNTHTSAVHHRQHVLNSHRPRLTRTNSSLSNVQRLAGLAPAPLSHLSQKQELLPAAVVEAVVAGPSKQTREAKSQSPKKREQSRNQPRLTLASSSSGYETTDDSEDSWTDEIEQKIEQKIEQSKSAPQLDSTVEALHEEQRRYMFAKVDRKSYTELSMKRTQSGLLSSLLRPNPSLLSEGETCRLTRSTQDMSPSRTLKQSRYSTPSVFQAGKSPAAGPITVAEAAVGRALQSGSNGRSNLRLKGRPEGDFEESDSGEDDAENTIQMSNSLAVQRLAALHGRRSSNTAPPSAVEQEPSQSPPVLATVTNDLPPAHVTSPIPVALAFPYNLPPPMPPSTPRTTRRHMLANELSESLRRNLLWERQVSKLRPTRKLVGGTNDSNARPIFSSNTSVSSRKSNDTDGSNTTTQDSREEERRKALTRHRTWAAEFNGAGW